MNAEVLDLFFLFLAVGDVAADADEAGKLALVIEERRFERFGDHQVPVGIHNRFLAAHRLPKRENLLVCLDKCSCRLVVIQLEVGFPDQPVFGNAGGQFKRPVAAKINTVDILIKDVVGNGIQQCSKKEG